MKYLLLASWARCLEIFSRVSKLIIALFPKKTPKFRTSTVSYLPTHLEYDNMTLSWLELVWGFPPLHSMWMWDVGGKVFIFICDKYQGVSHRLWRQRAKRSLATMIEMRKSFEPATITAGHGCDIACLYLFIACGHEAWSLRCRHGMCSGIRSCPA